VSPRGELVKLGDLIEQAPAPEMETDLTTGGTSG
jgi:hypothetical protein